MCGLIGAVVSPDVDMRSAMHAGLAALYHRGPDHTAEEHMLVSGRCVWLGHTRLSVIDLDDDANQPMRSGDGRYRLIFNGEIYNYIELRDRLAAHGALFLTRSDTEVLLKAWEFWGEDCLDKLDGMFAFVVLDKMQRQLICVRDAFGVKPFYWYEAAGDLFFASELNALVKLLPCKPDADIRSAYRYLVHDEYDCDSHTFLEGVNQLRPGEIIKLDIENSTIGRARRWWRPRVEPSCKLSFKDAAEAVREEFLVNVRRQLRSDVPLGAALSGGIDSSAVVCAMRHLEPDAPIHTFSYVASDEAISEERWINIVNAHVGAESHVVNAHPTDLAVDMEDLIATQGEPFGSTSIYAQYRVFKLAKECGITVTLDGQGADELLAGYDGYPMSRTKSIRETDGYLTAAKFVLRRREWYGEGYGSAARTFLKGVSPDSVYGRARRAHRRKMVPPWLKVDALDQEPMDHCSRDQNKPSVEDGRRLMAALADGLWGLGLPRLLRHADRNSMRFSVESRVPFLSTAFCNLLYGMPEDYLVSRQGTTKSVFRAAMRDIVPDSILRRRDKIGFATPERRWFLELLPIYRKWLLDSKVPFLDSDAMLRTVQSLATGRKSSFDWRHWRMVNYVRWYRTVFEA